MRISPQTTAYPAPQRNRAAELCPELFESKSGMRAVNQSLRICGSDVTGTSICLLRRQGVLHFESDARICDTRATRRMIAAHGTYVALRLLRAGE
jgi:hypothetical protein